MRAQHDEAPVRRREPPMGLHEQRETCRIDERHLRHVEDDVSRALRTLFEQLLNVGGRPEDDQLAAQRDKSRPDAQVRFAVDRIIAHVASTLRSDTRRFGRVCLWICLRPLGAGRRVPRDSPFLSGRGQSRSDHVGLPHTRDRIAVCYRR